MSRVRVTAAVLVVLAALGAGCEVSVGGADSPDAIERIHEAGQFRWDLRQGLTRDDVGLEGDAQRTTIGRGDPLDAEVVVSDDVTITYQVLGVFVEGIERGRPAEPSHIVLNNTFATVEEAFEELERAVEMVGIDQGEIHQWEASVRRERQQDTPAAFTPHVFRAPDADGVSIEVEAATTLPEGRVSINYHLGL